ncbi:uncharacterized protein LOC8076777 [Sorghum bicolor]|uniref:Uncharacterized protein n=1 Tax=Sorghum bicolor TaxID=4558 RepID=A0A1B6PQU5_SORBI|nr:uncharacterized protein LOC8076777 [Sorghum bicolor]KXG28042.1 hypothetical protein SORBI_3005G078800 [Sorghum bicolor]|eukprot:XP_002449209.2 uncharacterized protein LOC8076777 [Sorghum bicolor]
MGNTCFRGEDEEEGGQRRERYPYYQPQYHSYSGGGGDPPPAPRRHQQGLAAAAGPHGLASDPNIGHQQRSNGVPNSRVVATSQYQSNTEDIDESSAEGLCSAKSYAKANQLLIQVSVLGTTKKFWRLSDNATRISRKLVLILRSHHAVGKHLAAPLQVSNVWIGAAAGGGSVKLRGVSFTAKGFGVDRVRDDYRHLSRVLLAILRASAGGGHAAVASRLPPDYRDFLALLGSDTLSMDDEFLIVNNAALLPMKNRTEAFLMLHDRIVKHLGRTDRAKKKRILAGLPYEDDWLETARANATINQWVVNVQHHEYRRTQSDQLRLNRNVRSHLHEYGDDGGRVEEALYCEWPELLMAMVKLLHLEGELEDTDIENKFG